MAANERMNIAAEAPSSTSSVEPRVEQSGIMDREGSSNQGGGGGGGGGGVGGGVGYSAIGGMGAWPAPGMGDGMRAPSNSPMQFKAPGSPITLAALAAVPQARLVPFIQPPYSFFVPCKRINSVGDIRRFHESEAGKIFLGFVVGLNDSVKGMKISDYCRESPLIMSLVGILKRMSEWVDEIPPKQNPSRYGNLAFRDWQARLESQGPNLVRQVLPDNLAGAVVELFPYFQDSFGNASRIDFGTGHEVNFAAWLLCLAKLGLIKQDDYQAVVLRVFVEYLDLMRKLQTTYWLEPAGSHGVWGLDDYHFLPFIFGSAQLVDHKYMKPKSIHNQDILDHFSKEYLYLGCIEFVKKVKKGPLAEHSPMIDDISGVATWTKVNGGMIKMFKAEVLEKVPIMQHFLFGSLISW